MEISFVVVNLLGFYKLYSSFPGLLPPPLSTFFGLWSHGWGAAGDWECQQRTAGSNYMSHPALFVCDCVSFSVCFALAKRVSRTGNKSKHVVTQSCATMSAMLRLLSQQCRRYFGINLLYFVTFLCGALLLFLFFCGPCVRLYLDDIKAATLHNKRREKQDQSD